MKKIVVALFAAWCAIAPAEKPKPNPADFTVAIHVNASELFVDCGEVNNGGNDCAWTQKLKVTIDGKKYELRGNASRKDANLLHLGDYKAKILKEDVTKSYEYQRTYQFLFPDGEIAAYLVSGEYE